MAKHLALLRDTLRWLRRALLATVTLSVLVGCSAAVPPAMRNGQWVWSPADSAPLREARVGGPVMAGVWVATVSADSSGTALRGRLALSPAIGGPDSIAAVIRFESSLGLWWANVDDRQAAAAFGERVGAVLAMLEQTGVPIAEIQLDYDCPNLLLRRYLTVLEWLGRNTLAGRRVWATSLVTHLRDPDYLDALSGVVDGHILQLFDTGDRASDAQLEEIVRRLVRTDLPFRVGLGAFERALQDGPTDHRVWVRSLPRFQTLAGYRGWWIFPAGTSYHRLIEEFR